MIYQSLLKAYGVGRIATKVPRCYNAGVNDDAAADRI